MAKRTLHDNPSLHRKTPGTPRQQRPQRRFRPNRQQIDAATSLICSTLKHFTLEARDIKGAARKLVEKIGHACRCLGNTPSQRLATIECGLRRLLDERTVRVHKREFILAA